MRKPLVPTPPPPEWEEALEAKPTVTLETQEALARELVGRGLLDLNSLEGLGLVLIGLTLWRRTVRRPFR